MVTELLSLYCGAHVVESYRRESNISKPTRQKLYSIFRYMQVSDDIWENSVTTFYNPIPNQPNHNVSENSDTISPNDQNFSRNELVNFLSSEVRSELPNTVRCEIHNFISKFTNGLTTME